MLARMDVLDFTLQHLVYMTNVSIVQNVREYFMADLALQFIH